MNCYESKTIVRKSDLLVAEDSVFELTRNRIYVSLADGFGNTITVINDEGVKEEYSTEYFRFYNGETIGF